MVRILTSDALVLTGFIESEQPDQIVLRNTDGQSVTLERSDIEQLEPQVLSLMPEGLLEKLDDKQIRDLMAYLRSSQPLNDGT
jgi:putative heme-binding domain-containing protein